MHRHMRVSQSHPNTQPAQAGWEGGGKRAANLQALEKTRVRVGAAGGDRWSRFVSCPLPMVSYPSPPAAPSATTDSSDRPHGGLSDHPSDRHPQWTVKSKIVTLVLRKISKTSRADARQKR